MTKALELNMTNMSSLKPALHIAMISLMHMTYTNLQRSLSSYECPKAAICQVQCF